MHQIDDIRNKINRVLEDEGLTQQQIARGCGISPATLSAFVDNKYKGNNDKIAQTLADWLADHQQKSTLFEPPRFVETQTVKQIWKVFQYAQLAECISVVAGNPGVGKTESARRYSEKANVWLMTAAPSCATVTECLVELADTLGIEGCPRRKGDLARAIRKRLRGTAGLVIVDEADHLTMETLEELRSIQDATQVGMVLIGNLHTLSQMTGGGRRPVELARLFSRIAKPERILKAKKADIRAIADAWEISGEQERALLMGIGEKTGALRILNHTLRLAYVTASGEGRTMTEDDIRTAYKALNVDSELFNTH